MPYRPDDNYIKGYTGLKEKLLRETNYVYPKVSRTHTFWIGCVVGAVLGSLTTLLIIRLLIFFQEFAAV